MCNCNILTKITAISVPTMHPTCVLTSYYKSSISLAGLIVSAFCTSPQDPNEKGGMLQILKKVLWKLLEEMEKKTDNVQCCKSIHTLPIRENVSMSMGVEMDGWSCGWLNHWMVSRGGGSRDLWCYPLPISVGSAMREYDRVLQDSRVSCVFLCHKEYQLFPRGTEGK